MNVREEIFNNQDLEYRSFHCRLVPTVPAERIIGVRVPILRKIAKQAYESNAEILCDYYEEIMIKGFVIAMKRCSIEEHLTDIKDFLPLIDNWAVCDSFCSSLKFAKRNKEAVFEFIKQYINGTEYEVRFAIVMIMDYFLVDEYIDDCLQILTSIISDKYYINMALAWAISVAYIKYEEKTLPILKSKVLPAWVHNKSIQKICESYRIDKSKKDYLKSLKII